MSRVFVNGCGAVSPAGWGVPALCEAISGGTPLATEPGARTSWLQLISHRPVPAPTTIPSSFTHPRLRRASPISRFVASAAVEALGSDVDKVRDGRTSLGVIVCVMSGCVNYSRRFYDEVLKDPGTASPLVFPETVFNAPASHLAAVLGTIAINYTLVGDPGTFLQGLALAGDWVVTGRVDECVVIGAEELDWLTADAVQLFGKGTILASGAGALRIGRTETSTTKAELRCISDPQTYSHGRSRTEALATVRRELSGSEEGGLLCDGLQGVIKRDAAEVDVWRDWPGARISPKVVLGEGFAAASAWQCVAAIETLAAKQLSSATVSVLGCNEQAIGAHFVRAK